MPNTPATWLDAMTVNTTPAHALATVSNKGDMLIRWTATDHAPGQSASGRSRS